MVNAKSSFMNLSPKKLGLILEGCRKGKRTAQRSLYYHFYSYGLTVCLHYGRNREEAEEILHDGFLKVYKKINQYKGPAKFKPWFRRILVNVAIDYARKYPINKLDGKVIPIESTKNEAIRQLELEDAWKVLQKLPPAYRIVFNLFVLENFTHKEIAAQLEISVGTSKSNLARAKDKLKSIAGSFYQIKKAPNI